MSDSPFGPGVGEQTIRSGNQQPQEIVNDGGSDIDRFFDALGETRRRFILLFLNENETATLDQLAESTAEHEGGDTGGETVERICINLHHNHLPKLADQGLISYDTRTNTATLEPLPLAVEKILDLTRDLENTE